MIDPASIERAAVPGITLRPDQLADLDRIRESYRSGYRYTAFQAPTAYGKTMVFSAVCEKMIAAGKRVLILVHRRELIDQVSEALWSFNVEHSFVCPGYYFDARSMVHVASVFSLARRLHKLPTPDLIIIDEMHHAIAKSTWGKVLEHFSGSFRLGVSATPYRHSGEPLSDLFDNLILGPTVTELIERGSLSDYKIYAPTTISTEGIHTQMGDFVRSELVQLMDKPKITGDAVAQYRKYADGKRAIAFCVSVEHAHHVASEFTAAGYSAQALDGEMDRLHRKNIVNLFRDGAIQIITSCDLISEGFSVSAVEAGIFLRPTQSLTLYLQQVGRCLRSFPGKTHAILLDHVGHAGRFGLPCQHREWSLDGREKKAGKKKEQSDSTKICPSCFLVIRRVLQVCPCGHIFETTPRAVEEVDGELVEIDASTLRRQRNFEQGSAKDLEALIRIGKARGMRNPSGWAHIILKARQEKEAKRLAAKQKQEPLLDDWLTF